jgi:signal transduction histidine kinase
VSVTDSGAGIPPEIRTKILEPFFTTKDIGKGTGLGLSLVQSIVRTHKGEFYINDRSKNTEFVIKFPIKQLA